MKHEDKQKAATAVGEVAAAMACPAGISVAELMLNGDQESSATLIEFAMRAVLARLDATDDGFVVVPTPGLLLACVWQVLGSYGGSSPDGKAMIRVPADDGFFRSVPSSVLRDGLSSADASFTPWALRDMLRSSVVASDEAAVDEAYREIDDFVEHLYGVDGRSRVECVVDMTDVAGTA